MTDNTIPPPQRGADTLRPTASIQKWGGVASFVLAAVLVVPELIYLTGNLQTATGPLAYALADFLYGPVRAASLVTAVYALREHLGERAPRRTFLALLAAVFAAGMFVTAALLRSSNRHYHLVHPELNLENSPTVLIVWATQVTGVIATGWHCFGWSLMLLGWAGWTSGRLPWVLSVLTLIGGAISLFVYQLPDMEGAAVVVGVVVSIWQGLLLWQAASSGYRQSVD